MKDLVRSLHGLDRVVHEPARLMIVALLSVLDGADFVFLQRETGLNKGTLSSHLARLEEAGYVEIKKSFQGKTPRTVLGLTPAGRSAFEEYRRKMKSALDDGALPSAPAATH